MPGETPVMAGLSRDYDVVTMGLRALAALVLLSSPGAAQVVRGVVRDSLTQAPVPGVVVSLDAPSSAGDTAASGRRASLALSVLTNERGEFAVRAPAAGRWILSAKRVGLKRFESAPLDLAAGESRRMDLLLARIDFATLPEVAVTTDAPCAMNPAEGRRVAALWDEARAALTATRLSVRDRLFRATIVRYTRTLTPGALRVIGEDLSTRRGVTEQPFVSLAAQRLSAGGYVQVDQEGAHVYYAPDAGVLTSPEFLRDHCFRVARDTRARPGLAGLAFEPVSSRSQPDIRGALWLDSASFELRLVEFRYTNLPREQQLVEARGEVRFGHLPNGAWHVSRWFIRMPEYRAARPSPTIPLGGGMTLSHYKEEGGEVTVDGATSLVRGATLNGRALDSTGRAPLRGATVRLSGTRYATPVRADGSFTLDSLPAGAFTLVLEHPGYADLGMFATEQDLEIAEGRRSVTVVQALGTEQILRRLCGKGEFDMERTAARVVVRGTDGAPRQGIAIRVRYDSFAIPNTVNQSVRIQPQRLDTETDEQGAAVFCDLPSAQPVRFEAALTPERTPAHQVHKLPRHTITVVTFRP
jgi:hypothetical protein